jgi:hypothetical protein
MPAEEAARIIQVAATDRRRPKCFFIVADDSEVMGKP